MSVLHYRYFALKKLADWGADLLHLVYPETCLICDRELVQQKSICSICQSNFNYTYFEKFDEPSALDKLTWGRMEIATTAALFYFEKGGSTQDILHAIKYKGKRQLAEQMGALFGEKLFTNKEKYGQIQALVPVPLHPKKLFIRGYNQSTLLAKGLSSSMNIPVLHDFLLRNTHTESQTKKGRFKRWDNVESVFELATDKYKHLNHIALVDDVITTGSTLEACVKKIKEDLPHIQVSLLSLALAK
jgi:ComF family protein